MSKADFAEILERIRNIEELLKTNETSALASTSTKKVSKVKKEKDPNAPKRPLNVYFRQRKIASDFVDKKYENKNLTKTELTKKKVEKLDELRKDEKMSYQLSKDYENDNIAYKKIKKNYDDKKIANIAETYDSQSDSSSKDKGKEKVKKRPITLSSDTESEDSSSSKRKSESESDSEDDLKKKINKKRASDLLKINSLANSPSDDSE